MRMTSPRGESHFYITMNTLGAVETYGVCSSFDVDFDSGGSSKWCLFGKQSSSRDTCGSDLRTTKAAQSDQWPHKGE